MFGQPYISQPMMAPQPPKPPGMINLDGKQIHPAYGYQINQLIDHANQIQMDSSLQNLIFLLKVQVDKSIQVTEQASTFDWSKKQSTSLTRQEQVDYVRERCTKIKKKNQQILIKMLNLREKLISQMNMYRSRSQARELEMGQINEKIRDLKCEISFKYNKLRNLKMIKESEKLYKQIPKKTDLSINVPLVELKKGTELLQRQSLKLREQLTLVQKYMHGQAII